MGKSRRHFNRGCPQRLNESQDLKENNPVFWHHASVTRQRREALNGHRGAILWFTGLSCSGKSTLAHALEEELFGRGCRTFVLDGDNVRCGLSRDLGFSVPDRVENIRRIGEVAKLFKEAGMIVLAAFISPFQADRERVRDLIEPGDFLEIYCNSSVQVCEERDNKGLYQKARNGQLADFSGISSPYQVPPNPDLTVHTGTASIDACVRQLIDKMLLCKIIDPC